MCMKDTWEDTWWRHFVWTSGSQKKPLQKWYKHRHHHHHRIVKNWKTQLSCCCLSRSFSGSWEASSLVAEAALFFEEIVNKTEMNEMLQFVLQQVSTTTATEILLSPSLCCYYVLHFCRRFLSDRGWGRYSFSLLFSSSLAKMIIRQVMELQKALLLRDGAPWPRQPKPPGWRHARRERSRSKASDDPALFPEG